MSRRAAENAAVVVIWSVMLAPVLFWPFGWLIIH